MAPVGHLLHVGRVNRYLLMPLGIQDRDLEKLINYKKIKYLKITTHFSKVICFPAMNANTEIVLQKLGSYLIYALLFCFILFKCS